MDCTALLKRSEQQLLVGNLTTADAAVELIDCFPQVCEQVFGDADFDLAGTGIFVASIIQAALFVIFGTLQAYLSQCIPARASPSTRLIIARFQAVNDTVYSTGSFLSLALLVTCYVRTGQDNVSGLEQSIMRDVVDCHQMLQNLAMATYWVQKTPPNIKRSVRSWSDGSVYLVAQGLSLLTWNVKKRLDKIPATAAEMAPKLCSSLYEYPHLHTGAAAPGYNPFLVGTGLGLLFVVAGVGLSLLMPRVWSWSSKVFGSRGFLGTCCVLFSALSLFCIVWETLHLHWTRKDLESLPEWDLAQVCALLLWLRPAWHIALATLKIMSPEKPTKEARWWQTILGATVNTLYSFTFEEPSVKGEKAEKSGAEEGQQTLDNSVEKTTQPQLEAPAASVSEEDEKARLIDDTVERPRSPSPGQLV